MANKWKYASLPAAERLSMVRGGNKDVYDDEIARSMDVIRSRGELGLDIGEQKDWIDSVSYNYNLHNAEKMGIASSKVNQTGYADRLLGSSSPDSEKSKGSGIVNGPSKSELMQEAADMLWLATQSQIAKLDEELELTKEWLTNNGIAHDSADGKKFLKQTQKEINERAEALRKEYVTKLKEKIKTI